jgi:integrase
VNVNYRYIYEDVDRHGNVRIYFWRGKGHKKVRVHDRVGSPSFHTRYPELMQGDGQAPPDAGRTPKANTLGWLCVQYFGSKNFKSLNRRTQYVRRRIIESMLVEPIAPGARDTFANFPLQRLMPTTLEILRDRKEGAEAGNGRVKALRAVFDWGKRRQLVRSNIARDVEYNRHSGKGWHSWEPSELEKFEVRHSIGTKARLALDLLQYTGASGSDVVALGRGNTRDGRIQYRRAKTNVLVDLPTAEALRETIDTSPVIGTATLLVTQFGKPFSAAGFGNWFRDRCNEAGLPPAHGVRKAAPARAAVGRPPTSSW